MSNESSQVAAAEQPPQVRGRLRCGGSRQRGCRKIAVGGFARTSSLAAPTAAGIVAQATRFQQPSKVVGLAKLAYKTATATSGSSSFKSSSESDVLPPHWTAWPNMQKQA
jgi:hypothetical protein